MSRDRLPVASVAAATLTVGGVLAALLAPLHVVLGVGRLAGWILAAAGSWLAIRRTGAVDLAVGAAMGAGAFAAVLVASAGAPAWPALLAGPVAGAVVGGVSGALTGRLGRRFAALATLTLGIGLVAVAAALLPGGAAGYHAIPLLVGDRPDVALAVLLAGAGAFLAQAAGRTVTASRASVAARRPEVLEALGASAVGTAAAAGAWAGSLLGLAGAVAAILSGSVVPGAYGLQTTAGLALAGLIGGAAPLGPFLGAGLVWGPGILFPLAPWIGSAPPLLFAGALGLAILAARRGRGLALAPRSLAQAAAPVDPSADPAHLVVDERVGVGFEVRGGQVIAVVGPNGAGKSTLLARIGGQLPDRGGVLLDGEPLPRGARRRAAEGIGRTWQRPPDVPGGDLLGAGIGTPAASPSAAEAQIEILQRRPPRVALLDEPDLPLHEVAQLVERLTSSGAAVVVVDHRAAVHALADRVVHLSRQRGSDGPLREPVGASLLDDLDVVVRGADRDRRTAVRVVVDDAAVADDVSVLDHLAALVGPRGARRILQSVPLLAGRGQDLAGVLSGGERRVLALVTALVRRPRVLELADADHGLDADATAWAAAAIRAAQAAGCDVIVRSSRDGPAHPADFGPD